MKIRVPVLTAAIVAVVTVSAAPDAADAASYKRCQRQYRSCNSSCTMGDKGCFEQCQNNVFSCAHDVDVANGKVKAAARMSTPRRPGTPGTITSGGGISNNQPVSHSTGGRHR
jgi:hypothetical protein